MSDWLRDDALVGAGGFLGALGRFLITGWLQARVEHFPYGTLTVNLIGSLALGFLVTALADRVVTDSSLRLLSMVGSSVRSPRSRRSDTRRRSCGRTAAGWR